MNAEQLAEWLQQRLHMEVRHVLNWGGFVNHSFSLVDGSSRYHLKITNDAGNLIGLQRWRNIHHILEHRYRTPRLLDWMDFPEIGFAGLLLEHIENHTADFRANPDL